MKWNNCSIAYIFWYLSTDLIFLSEVALCLSAIFLTLFIFLIPTLGLVDDIQIIQYTLSIKNILKVNKIWTCGMKSYLSTI